MPDSLLNEAFGFARPVQVGQRRVSWPFYQNGDLASTVTETDFVQLRANYIPPLVGVARDPFDPLGYVINPERSPSFDLRTQLVRSTVRYARIPGQQVSYPGSRYFPLPSVGSMGESSDMITVRWATNSTIGTSLYLSETATVFVESANALYGPTKDQTARVIGVASGGTFTLTFGASTTGALNWNDSGATIAAALNGLASVIAAGLTATCTNFLNLATGGQLGILWSGGYTASPVTMNAGSLTVTTSNHPTTNVLDALNQLIFLPDHYTIAGHGFNGSLELVTTDNAVSTVARVFSSTYWGVIDANTVWVPNIPTPFLYYRFGTFLRTYKPGSQILLRTRLTEDFFLPGVTPGIATASDIPITLGLQNPADFFQALVSLTGWQTYETEGPAFWLGGPIYRRAYTAINVDDFN